MIVTLIRLKLICEIVKKLKSTYFIFNLITISILIFACNERENNNFDS